MRKLYITLFVIDQIVLNAALCHLIYKAIKYPVEHYSVLVKNHVVKTQHQLIMLLQVLYYSMFTDRAFNIVKLHPLYVYVLLRLAYGLRLICILYALHISSD